jgi:hypothetical protein
MCSSRPPVKDFNVGVGTDSHQCGRWLEPDGLVKAGLELANWPVDQKDGGAFIHPDDTAEPVLKAYYVADAEPELMLFRPPEQADELRLVGIATIPLSELGFHTSII